MGQIKYLAKVRDFFRKTPVVTLASLRKIVGGKGEYVYLMVRNLIKGGEIKRIARGVYSLYDDPSLAVFCFKPAYLGLQEALSLHNLWEQESNTVILTVRKVRTGRREIFGSNVLIRRIKPAYFFGFEYLKSGDLYVPVSDLEKTLIDLVYFKQPLDKELLKNFRERLDRKKLAGYLKKYPDWLKKRVRTKLRKG